MTIKRVLILPDVHMTTKLPRAYKIVKRFIKKQKKFDEIILLGDFLDVDSLSHWNKDMSRKVEGKRFKKEMDLANKELDFLCKHTSQVTWLMGNHEQWIERYIDFRPEIEGMIEIKTVCKTVQRGIKVIKYNDLYKVGKMYFTHGMYVNKYHSNKHLVSLGCSVCYGHTHNTQTFMMNMKMQKPLMSYGLGCLCGHSPDYMKNKPSNWIAQFGIMYYNERGKFNLYPINIIQKSFVWEGVEYK